MFESVQRLPRSYSESKHWTPDWRNRQAMAYLAAYDERCPLGANEGAPERFERALAQGIRFPERENDPIVMERFRHAAGARMPASPRTQALDWCQEFTGTDFSLQSTTAIKGWLLAGLTDEEITRRLPISTVAITVFHDVWFDVRGSLRSPEALWQVLCGTPLPTGAAEWQRRERAVFRAALVYGAEAVDRLLIPNHRVCAGDFERQVSPTVRHMDADLETPRLTGGTNDASRVISRLLDKRAVAIGKLMGIA